MSVFLKDPAATLDYAIDWTALAGESSVAESHWAVAPDEPGGVASLGELTADYRTAITLGGGVAGRLYHVTNSVRFADDRRDARMLVVRVDAR